MPWLDGTQRGRAPEPGATLCSTISVTALPCRCPPFMPLLPCRGRRDHGSPPHTTAPVATRPSRLTGFSHRDMRRRYRAGVGLGADKAPSLVLRGQPLAVIELIEGGLIGVTDRV